MLSCVKYTVLLHIIFMKILLYSSFYAVSDYNAKFIRGDMPEKHIAVKDTSTVSVVVCKYCRRAHDKHSDACCWILQWRHNGHNGVSNHQPHDCLLKRLFGRRSKRTPKLRVNSFYEGNSPVTKQRASNAKMFPFDDVITISLNFYFVGAKLENFHIVTYCLSWENLSNIEPWWSWWF